MHRRTLDDVWRQVLRRLGSNPETLLGPTHDALVNERMMGRPFPERREDAINFLARLIDTAFTDSRQSATPERLAAIAYDYLMPPRPHIPEPGKSPQEIKAEVIKSVTDHPAKGSYGDLDYPAENHYDPSKRGFNPK